jgi:RHS repeat-associated protein
VMSFAILAVLLARPLLAGDSMATYEVTLTATGASSGVKAAARGVAAAYGATVEPGEINEDRRTFVVRMKPESAALMRGDPRIQSTRPLQSRAHVSTILPPMDLGVYLYDGAGNIESIGNDQFRYDEAGRLKSATVNGSANQQTFTYDAFGNRKDAARAASASVCIGNTNCEMAAPVETTNTNHLTAATYDDAGNVQVLDGTYSYSYDALNMVKSTGGREYVYTADDERIATVSGGGWTWTIRSPGQQVLSEFTSSGTNGASNWRWTRDHIWRGASLLAVEEKNASDVTVTRHFHLDHLGTPRLITNGTGQQIGLHAYYPFGTELLSSTTEAPPDNIKFTGHEWDDLGGDIHALTYMHARYYSAALGRFLSVDPQLDPNQLIHSPQRWNRYAYVSNNPVRKVDIDGRDENEIEILWHRFKHVINNHINKENRPTKSKFATDDPEKVKELIKETVKKENLIEQQVNGNKIYSKDFGESVGTAGETAVEAVTAPTNANAETLITARPSVAGTALGVLAYIGPVLNIYTYSKIFEKQYGRAPTLGETAHYLMTGDTRSSEKIMVEAIHPPPI